MQQNHLIQSYHPGNPVQLFKSATTDPEENGMTLDLVSNMITKRASLFQLPEIPRSASKKNQFWNEVARTLANEGMQNFQVTDEHINYLFFSFKPEDLREVIRVVQILRYRRLGEFNDLLCICRLSHTNGDMDHLSCKIRGVLRTLFVFEINLRLQTLYRLYRDSSVIIGIQTDEISSGLEEPAYTLLQTLDLPGMIDWLGYTDKNGELDTLLQRLSNYFFCLKRVNLRFTHHCNITCRHCYNSSGPHVKDMRIPLDRMMRIIDQMPSAGIMGLTVTGGEPFLYLDDVISIVRHARCHGVQSIAVLTNASWAIDIDHASRILLRLKNAGFGSIHDSIKASAGVFHQEYVPVERVLILTEAYYTVFGQPLRIDFEKQHENDHIDFVEMLRLRGLSGKVTIKFRTIARLGRGKSLTCALSSSDLHTPCSGINQIVFDPDGTVRPCCGLNVQNFGIVVGRHDKLRTLIKSIQNNPVLQFLASHPIEHIFAYTGKNSGKYFSKCEACQAAVGDIHDTDHLKSSLAPLKEYFPFWFSKDTLLD